MRSLLSSVVVLGVLIGLPVSGAAQSEPAARPADAVEAGQATGSGSGSGSGSGAATSSQASARTSKGSGEAADQAQTRVTPSPAATRNLSNVQIELTITDQLGNGPTQKKIVSMIAASGTWGKIRAAGTARPNERSGVVPVGLNVDARPFLMPDGIVQVELTILYNPLDPLGAERNEPTGQVRPTELNQSLTVVLQNGKPLVVSQAADPVSDRKIIVEVKATVLK